MDVLIAIIKCLIGQDDASSPYSKPTSFEFISEKSKQAEQASSILSILFTSEKIGQDNKGHLKEVIIAIDWTEGLAKRVLDGLVAALESGVVMGAAMKEAFDRASLVASEFVREHPVLSAAILTLVAIGILVILLPWAVEALGLGELGPIQGSFAAFWQSTFPDVESGSFFSYLQRLGMKWGGK